MAITGNAVLFFVLAVWTVIWKGITLWKTARKSQMYWFLAILILNTLGILPIIYLLIEKQKAGGFKKKPFKAIRSIKAKAKKKAKSKSKKKKAKKKKKKK